MEVIIAKNGQRVGKVSIEKTLATMEVGESWVVHRTVSPIENIRTYVTRYGRNTGRLFKARTTCDHEYIKIIRTK